jgi:hypothetical protein
MVATAGAGPFPIPYRKLNRENMVEAIHFLLKPTTMAAAAKIAAQMQCETGVKNAADSFHRNLPLKALECDILPSEVACWLYKKGGRQIKLSEKAASILLAKKLVDAKHFSL